jgi:hypothetical protein
VDAGGGCVVLDVGCDRVDAVSARVDTPSVVVEPPRTSLWVSSASSSLSSPSASNASARSSLTLESHGVLDDALDRNDGGGELGIGCVGLGAVVSVGDSK